MIESSFSLIFVRLLNKIRLKDGSSNWPTKLALTFIPLSCYKIRYGVKVHSFYYGYAMLESKSITKKIKSI